jgi:thiol-disulfide isomerase/thioredoxin
MLESGRRRGAAPLRLTDRHCGRAEGLNDVIATHTRLLASLLSFSLFLACTTLRAGDSPVGTKPPEWQATHWLNSKPLALKDLTGKVVLVRRGTAPGCPYCAATAPALNELHERYKDKGLVVIGLYHHKSGAPLGPAAVKRSAERFGFRFPVAVDPGWRTLRRGWLGTGDRRWTSVSFLIGRGGVVRFVHPGGRYAKGDRAYEALKAKVEELLKEE